MRISQGEGARWLLARLVLVTLAFAATFVLVYVVTVRTLEGRLLGDASLRGALLTNSTLASATDRVLNVISVASLLAALALIAVIALVRLARLPGLAAITIMAGSNVSTLLLKSYILARPDLGADEVSPATLNSMPSGHTTAAFSAVVALVFVLPRRWRLPTAVLGTAYATVTGLATMSAGWHRASDSIAAFLLVGVWGMVAAIVLVVSEAAPGTVAGSSATGQAVLRRRVEAVSLGCVALGVTLSLALTAIPSLRDTTVGSAAAFAAGGLLIAGTSTVVLVAVLSALDLAEGHAPPTGPR